MAKVNKFAAMLVGSSEEPTIEAPAIKSAAIRAMPSLSAIPASPGRAPESDTSEPKSVASWNDMRSSMKLNPATRGVAQALEASEAKHADEIERLNKMLANGLQVQDLDTSLIDPSFVSDRMEINEEDVRDLSNQIKAQGQLIPILVRPHPTEAGRFQTAYGHRRRLACSILGRTVRAIVRDLTDDELIIAQGQENNARLNLTYIERALFAKKLVDRQTPRPIIASALGFTSVAPVTWFLKIVTSLTPDLITRIGPAPSIGRRRWEELVDLVNGVEGRLLKAIEHSEKPEFSQMDSDGRFNMLLTLLSKKEPTAPSPRASTNAIKLASGLLIGSVSNAAGHSTIKLDRAVADGFSDFLISRMEQLHEEWAASTK